MPGPADLRLRHLSKAYGAVAAVDGVSLDVEHGEFLSLVGPSGCGKTTILRMIAGLIEPDAGQILLGEEDITDRPVHRRNVGLVFQSYALFPHMTAFENVAFGLRRRGVAGRAVGERVGRALALVRLAEHGSRTPRQLSGGQQQRVALARALVTEPRVLLLDEPLSNLDAVLRLEMRVELKRLQERLRTTTIFVTHDQAEALTLSDRVAVLDRGRLEQVDTPEAIYRRPASVFVARFVGRSNFLSGAVTEAGAGRARVRLDGGLEVAAADGGPLRAGDRVEVTLRQESIRLSAVAPRGPNTFPVTVVFHAFGGASHQYVVQLADGRELQVEGEGASSPFARGARVHATWRPEDVILLPAAAAPR